MKKSLIFGAAAVALAGFASCSSEEPAVAAPQEEGVAFNIVVPGNMTRATFGDQVTVALNNLQFSVYEVNTVTNDKTFKFSGSKTNPFAEDALHETVNLSLGKGISYQIVFFADKNNNGFVSFTDGKIHCDYSNLVSNSEEYDAFVGVSDVFMVGDSETQTVTLYRPFAQLNWGTSDLDVPAVQTHWNNLTASVEVTKGIYSEYDVISGTYSGETTAKFADVAFSNLPTMEFPYGTTYKLLAMNYLLSPKGTINCRLVFNEGFAAVDINSANVEPNYRTNIYGSLLTDPQMFNILVSPGFTDSYNYPDGSPE